MSMNSAEHSEAMVRERDAERYAAMLRGDISSLAQIFGEDLRYVHSSGLVDDRETYLAAIERGDMRYDQIEREEEECHILGDTALVEGVIKIQATFRGTIFRVAGRFLSVWAKRNGQWRHIRWHATKIS